MVITYHGGSFIKVVFGDTTLAFNPISKDSKLKPTRFGADIALVSQLHPDCNGIDQVAHGDKTPFEITGPGEYEVSGVTVLGYPGTTTYGGDEMNNTLYVVTLEGMRIGFLGTQESEQLPTSATETLDGIDVLFVPISGKGTLDATKAHELSVKLEAKITIPTCYDDASLKQFLKEAGQEAKKEAKLTLKKKDVDSRSGDIVVLG